MTLPPGHGTSRPLIPTMRDKMVEGKPFVRDSTVRRVVATAQERAWAFNSCSPAEAERRAELLDVLLGRVGDGVEVRGPLHVELGERISVGDRTVIAPGVSINDVAPVAIGADVVLGAGVAISTLLLPHQADKRREKWAGGAAVRIGNNVWIGAGAVICPGVTIGDDAVVEAGSVVATDVEAATVVAGNPARVIRRL